MTNRLVRAVMLACGLVASCGPTGDECNTCEVDCVRFCYDSPIGSADDCVDDCARLCAARCDGPREE